MYVLIMDHLDNLNVGTFDLIIRSSFTLPLFLFHSITDIAFCNFVSIRIYLMHFSYEMEMGQF